MYKQTPAEYRVLHKKEPFQEVNNISEQYTLVISPHFLIELSKHISQKDQSVKVKESGVSFSGTYQPAARACSCDG